MDSEDDKIVYMLALTALNLKDEVETITWHEAMLKAVKDIQGEDDEE